MQNEIHEYFGRKSTDWGIISFLDESGIEPFDKKIDAYIKSLNNIASEQDGKRPQKARILLKMYKEEPRNDYKLARQWAMHKSANDSSVYFYNPKVTITNSVVEVGVTLNSVSKRDKKDDDDFDDKQKIKRTKYTTPPQPLYKAYNLRPHTDKTLDIKSTTFSSASTDTSYVPYFDSPTSENSIKARKPYYIDYFVGLGNVEWELMEDTTRWIVNEIDISVICVEYRASIIEKCKAREILNSDEELALSHVFLFQEENLQGPREFFDDELWQCIFSEIRTKYSYVDIPEHVFDLCATVVKIASRQQDPRKRRTEIKSYLKNYKTNGEFDEIMNDILYRL